MNEAVVTVERPAGAAVQHLTFVIGGQEFGVPLLRVREVIEFIEPTRIPGAPSCFRGVINLRGQVIPAVDIAGKLSTVLSPITRRTCIAIVEARWDDEQLLLGVLVDEVVDVIELRDAEVEPVPAIGTRIRLDFLRGVGKWESRLVLLLQIDRILSPEELLAATELATEDRPRPHSAAG